MSTISVARKLGPEGPKKTGLGKPPLHDPVWGYPPVGKLWAQPGRNSLFSRWRNARGGQTVVLTGEGIGQSEEISAPGGPKKKRNPPADTS